MWLYIVVEFDTVYKCAEEFIAHTCYDTEHTQESTIVNNFNIMCRLIGAIFQSYTRGRLSTICDNKLQVTII